MTNVTMVSKLVKKWAFSSLKISSVMQNLNTMLTAMWKCRGWVVVGCFNFCMTWRCKLNYFWKWRISHFFGFVIGTEYATLQFAWMFLNTWTNCSAYKDVIPMAINYLTHKKKKAWEKGSFDRGTPSTTKQLPNSENVKSNGWCFFMKNSIPRFQNTGEHKATGNLFSVSFDGAGCAPA
jgi:hypothetical protein